MYIICSLGHSKATLHAPHTLRYTTDKLRSGWPSSWSRVCIQSNILGSLILKISLIFGLTYRILDWPRSHPPPPLNDLQARVPAGAEALEMALRTLSENARDDAFSLAGFRGRAGGTGSLCPAFTKSHDSFQLYTRTTSSTWFFGYAFSPIYLVR